MFSLMIELFLLEPHSSRSMKRDFINSLDDSFDANVVQNVQISSGVQAIDPNQSSSKGSSPNAMLAEER